MPTTMRLQVLIYPPQGLPSRPAPYSFLEITKPTITLDELASSIESRHSRLYPHLPQLIIHKLQDADSNDLDLSYTVGDVFSDKSTDKNSSVVRVIQSSPDRESSIPPESGLRPQYRKETSSRKRIPPVLDRGFSSALRSSIVSEAELGDSDIDLEDTSRRKRLKAGSDVSETPFQQEDTIYEQIIPESSFIGTEDGEGVGWSKQMPPPNRRLFPNPNSTLIEPNTVTSPLPTVSDTPGFQFTRTRRSQQRDKDKAPKSPVLEKRTLQSSLHTQPPTTAQAPAPALNNLREKEPNVTPAAGNKSYNESKTSQLISSREGVEVTTKEQSKAALSWKKEREPLEMSSTTDTSRCEDSESEGNVKEVQPERSINKYHIDTPSVQLLSGLVSQDSLRQSPLLERSTTHNKANPEREARAKAAEARRLEALAKGEKIETAKSKDKELEGGEKADKPQTTAKSQDNILQPDKAPKDISKEHQTLASEDAKHVIKAVEDAQELAQRDLQTMEPSKSTTNAQQKKDLKRSSKQAQEKKKLEREEERKKKAEEKERRAKERLELAEKRKKERDEKQQKLKDEKEKKLQDGKQKSSITTSASQKASAVDSVPNSSALTVPLHANAPTATPPTAANQKRARSGSGTPPKEEKNREKKQKTSNGLDNDYSETVISGLPRPSAANKSSVLRKTAQNLSAGGNVVDTPDKTRRSVSFANSSQVDPEAPKVPLRPGTPGVKKTPILPPGYVTDGASIVPASKVSAKGKGKTDSQAEKVKTPIPLPNVTPISAPISKAGSGNMQATKTPNKRKNTKLSEEVVGSGESTHEPESDTNNDRGKSTVPNIGSNASSVNLEKAKSIQPTKDASESESGSNSDIDSDSEPVPAKKEASLPTADTKAISVPGRITRQTISPVLFPPLPKATRTKRTATETKSQSTAPKKNEELTPASGNEHESTGGTEVNEPMQNKPQEKPTTTKADTKSATPKSSASVFSESEDEDESAESVDTSDTSDISESSDASDSEEDSSSDASSPSASPKATKVADKITKAIAATTKISSPAANFPPDIPPSSQKYKALSQMAFSDPPEVLEKYAAAASKENQQSTQASKLTEDSDDDDDDDEDSETESETDSNSDIIPTDKKAGAEFTGGKRKSRKQNSLGGFFSRRKSGVSTK